MRRKNLNVDAPVLIKDAAKLLPNPSRRLFLRGGASLGALTLLTGCDIVDGPTSERALRVISEFNDWVQARLFNPNRLAQTYAESAITRPFRFNGYYDESEAPDVDEALRAGQLKFSLYGAKLHGSWALVRTVIGGSPRTKWLLVKHRDGYASSEDLTIKKPRSAVSNKLLAEIAKENGGDGVKAAKGDPLIKTAAPRRA